MSRTVEYAGRKNPHENLEGFIKMVNARYPGIKTQEQLNQLVMRATVDRKQRFDTFSFVLFGRDVLRDDLTSNPAWAYVPASVDRKIRAIPVRDRERVITVEGLQQTYIWCKPVDWLQQVSDDDYERLRMSPYWQFFRDVDIQGRHVEVRAYDHWEFERIPAKSADEGALILAERKRRNYISGANLAPSTGEHRP